MTSPAKCPQCTVQLNGVSVSYEIDDGANATTEYYDSLADLWRVWIDEYVSRSDIPRLIVRFEDMLFHAENVMEAIRRCVGVASEASPTAADEAPFYYEIGKSKDRGSDFVQALERYGTGKNRFRGMKRDDLAYTKTAFPDDLMELFGYAAYK